MSECPEKQLLDSSVALTDGSRHGNIIRWYNNSACKALSPCLSGVDAELHSFFSTAAIPDTEQQMSVYDWNFACIWHGIEGHDLDAQSPELTLLSLLICSCGPQF